ncbi:ATPase, T2SS/T4P/T4SS family [Bordetella pseudohinzii]|uniref:Twitching mobility protein n=1 Tax=Bordetella pseudohinzii TaxID=1331258 RepID=A0A0J6BQI5_9BORD|nr:ATPase, T2SS/T4P/T4SS family [Bordetella pseudohinzii]ANY18505.1 hypothetical protein BBN53_21005 [Bordetella pseudohinzii]KMM24094.1 hypothetical protein L540_08175 [Bordetella pseudohinzii]KXA77840.1 hypothetical protein AW878_14180 [Bordetella pseudohinzii]KXA78036.1 hypothetical protein AW877_12640 [Bordetella pseudohinzii]CUJ13854.1 Twitching mobility protein [Bordetella pseudohinzii]
MDALTDMDFEDLYLGTGINKMRTPSGVLKQIPEQMLQDARDILMLCQETRANKGRSEFAIKIAKVKYRVTAMTNDAGVDLFVISKSGGKPRDITTLGLPKKALEMIRSPGAKGLILVLGGQGVGKTTAISSMIADRCRTFGHFGLTVENPTECDLDGPHGDGHITQIDVASVTGGFEEATKRALRSRADVFMISEIRERETAIEVLNFAPSGRLLLATMHAETIEQGLQRLQEYCMEESGASGHALGRNSMLADALLMIVLLQVHIDTELGGTNPIKRRMAQALVLDGQDGYAIRQNIREGKFSALTSYLNLQQEHLRWKSL